MQRELVKRDLSQNLFKAFLVIGMVLSHSLQILTPAQGVFYFFTVYINFMTFSGFMFSFGFVYQMVYAKKRIDVNFSINKLKTTLFAFYISSIVWTVLVEHEFSVRSTLDILLLLNVAPYSEYLLAFFLISAAYFIFKRPINIITNHPVKMLIYILGILLISLIPFYKFYQGISVFNQSIDLDPYLEMLLGSSNDNYYPVIPYSVFFILGVWFQKNRIDYSNLIAVVSIGGTILCLIYRLVFDAFPQRFPPHPLWLAGSFSFVYLYFLVSKRWKERFFTNQLNLIGENSLVYLLLSNLLLFSLKGIRSWSYGEAVLLGILIVLLISYIISITRTYKAEVKTG